MTQNKPIVAVEGGRARGRRSGHAGSRRISCIGRLRGGARGRCGGRGGERDDGKLLAREAVAGVRAREEIVARGGEGDFCGAGG